MAIDFPTIENTSRQQNCNKNVNHKQNRVFLRILCSKDIKSRDFNSQLIWLDIKRKHISNFFERILNIFFLLDTA